MRLFIDGVRNDPLNGSFRHAALLKHESPKAQFMEKRSKGYALMTAQRAAAAVERRRQ